MLTIRMQRTGRKGHPHFRVVVQDARRTPTSGKIVAALGSYNPHSKATTLDKERAAFYLEHGAQPSNRVVGLLKQEGVKLPSWVTTPVATERKLRNPEKLRRNQPAAPAEEAPAAEAPEPPKEEAETPTETVEEKPEAVAEEPATEEDKPEA